MPHLNLLQFPAFNSLLFKLGWRAIWIPTKIIFPHFLAFILYLLKLLSHTQGYLGPWFSRWMEPTMWKWAQNVWTARDYGFSDLTDTLIITLLSWLSLKTDSEWVERIVNFVHFINNVSLGKEDRLVISYLS